MMTGDSGSFVRLPSVTTARLTTLPEAPAVATTGMMISTRSPFVQSDPRLQEKVLPMVAHSAEEKQAAAEAAA